MAIKNTPTGCETALSASAQAVDAKIARGAPARALSPFKMGRYTIDGKFARAGNFETCGDDERAGSQGRAQGSRSHHPEGVLT